MKTSRFTRLAGPALVAALATLAVAPAAHAQPAAVNHPQVRAGAVYTETNSTSGNSLEVFYRSHSGALTEGGSYATGGTGTGTGLGSGHSVIASRSGRTVLAVNAGSDSVSAFRVGTRGLRQLGHATASGGSTPTSVTISGKRVYVLNAGSGTISGFRLSAKGLTAIPGSTQTLAASGTGTDSQIQFDKTGHVLIVDERGGVNKIQTFVVGHDGVARPAETVDSTAGGPFGFDVDHAGHVLFSDTAIAGSSGASSYDVSVRGALHQNGAPVATGEAAACWLAAVGHYAYTDNAASGSISTFAVTSSGALKLAGTTDLGTTAHPLDMAGANNKFLYVLADRLHEIIGYRVAQDGSLTQVSQVPVQDGVAGLGAH